MKLEEMRAEIASHTDFKEEKTKIEHILNDLGHVCIFLPKFHCELNLIGLKPRDILVPTQITQLHALGQMYP